MRALLAACLVASPLLEVAAAHPVDRERVYLTGLSMYGFCTFALLEHRADWFALAAPIRGGGDTDVLDRLFAQRRDPARLVTGRATAFPARATAATSTSCATCGPRSTRRSR